MLRKILIGFYLCASSMVWSYSYQQIKIYDPKSLWNTLPTGQTLTYTAGVDLLQSIHPNGGTASVQPSWISGQAINFTNPSAATIWTGDYAGGGLTGVADVVYKVDMNTNSTATNQIGLVVRGDGTGTTGVPNNAYYWQWQTNGTSYLDRSDGSGNNTRLQTNSYTLPSPFTGTGWVMHLQNCLAGNPSGNTSTAALESVDSTFPNGYLGFYSFLNPGGSNSFDNPVAWLPGLEMYVGGNSLSSGGHGYPSDWRFEYLYDANTSNSLGWYLIGTHYATNSMLDGFTDAHTGDTSATILHSLYTNWSTVVNSTNGATPVGVMCVLCGYNDLNNCISTTATRANICNYITEAAHVTSGPIFIAPVWPFASDTHNWAAYAQAELDGYNDAIALGVSTSQAHFISSSTMGAGVGTQTQFNQTCGDNQPEYIPSNTGINVMGDNIFNAMYAVLIPPTPTNTPTSTPTWTPTITPTASPTPTSTSTPTITPIPTKTPCTGAPCGQWYQQQRRRRRSDLPGPFRPNEFVYDITLEGVFQE